MSKITMKMFVQKTIDKYLEKRQHLCKDFTNSKMERIKNTIYKMVMECLEICLLLSKKASPEKYIELIDIIIYDTVENYNEYLPFRVNLDPEKNKKNNRKNKNPE